MTDAESEESPFIMVGDMKVNAVDYYHVLPVVQLVHDDIKDQLETDAERSALTIEGVFNKLVHVDRNSRITSLEIGWDSLDLEMATLPSAIYLLDALECLTIEDVPNITSLPNGIDRLINLKELRVCSLDNVASLPETIGEMQALETLRVIGCQSLTCLPARLPINLVDISFEYTPIRALPETLGELSKVKYFSADFSSLASLPASFANLTTLRTLGTGESRFDFDVPVAVLEFPELQRLSTALQSLGHFLPGRRNPEDFFLFTEVVDPDDLNGFPDGLAHLRGFRNVSSIVLSIDIDCDYTGEFPNDFDFASVIGALPDAKSFTLVLSDSRTNYNHRTALSLGALVSANSITSLTLEDIRLRLDDEVGSPLVLPRLRSLDLAACDIQFPALSKLQLPSLRMVQIGDFALNDEMFELLCTAWSTQSMDLQRMCFDGCSISSISKRSIEALATLKLCYFSIDNNPILAARVDDSQEDVLMRAEKQLLPLVEKCHFLVGGLENAGSEKLNHAMLLNEARSKVFCGQPILLSVWPMALQNCTKAFIPDYWSEIKIAQADATYLLLRKRAALDIFVNGKRNFDTVVKRRASKPISKRGLPGLLTVCLMIAIVKYCGAFSFKNAQPLQQRLVSNCHIPYRKTLLHGTTQDNSIANESTTNSPAPIRLNKVFKATHSRREADALIESGRISVNGQPVEQKGGFKVQPFVDEVFLDGNLVEGWEAMNGIFKEDDMTAKKDDQQQSAKSSTLEYIKYWKPRGVTCTTDQSVESNIIDDLLENRGYQPKHRVYPVGRLDKDTSGLILLTSDGRLPNSALRGKFKQPKVYKVLVHKAIDDEDLQQLRDGVVITTVAQRDGKNRGKSLTAPTLPCQVDRLPNTRRRGVRMVLVEGRNRQIRKMMEALGYSVVKLHRVQFMGLTLAPLQQAGEWTDLDKQEMKMVQEVLDRAEEETNAN